MEGGRSDKTLSSGCMTVFETRSRVVVGVLVFGGNYRPKPITHSCRRGREGGDIPAIYGKPLAMQRFSAGVYRIRSLGRMSKKLPAEYLDVEERSNIKKAVRNGCFVIFSFEETHGKHASVVKQHCFYSITACCS